MLVTMKAEKHQNITLQLLKVSSYDHWISKQSPIIKSWLKANTFTANAGACSLIPSIKGGVEMALAIIDDEPDIWSIAHLPARLPAGEYALKSDLPKETLAQLALGWRLACYQFTRYKKNEKKLPALVLPKSIDQSLIDSMVAAIGWSRDLINTPANDMNPESLAAEAVRFGKYHKGEVTVIKGEDLLKQNWPMVYAVGKAASVPPHLVDLRFGKKTAPKITLVGKGVCFDSGGLDIKSTAGMKLMKKDMGGAAAVLALAKMIIDSKLPVRLRVLLPIVENAISGNAMRPLDIVATRKGLTVEIGNTDAEGRLILCDALHEADLEKPDLLIDCATLTGAARVALGTDIPAFFTHDNKLADELMRHSHATSDPLWRLPLWKPYRSLLETKNADLSNDPDSGYGGAITAALYLAEFVSRTPAWLHIDMMAWNVSDRPGRPKGGEAMAVRALFSMIKERYGR